LRANDSFTILGTRDLLDVSFLTVAMRTIETPTGERIERVVVKHPGAVAVVPVIDDDVILIEQYRAAAQDVVLEIPAGKIDHPSDDRAATAHRELLEETGFTAQSMTILTDLWTAVGFSDERIAIFLAEDLSEATRAPAGAEEELARIIRMPFTTALAMVKDGEITDAKSVAGLLLAAAHHGPS